MNTPTLWVANISAWRRSVFPSSKLTNLFNTRLEFPIHSLWPAAELSPQPSYVTSSCKSAIQVRTEYWKEHLIKVLQPYFCQGFAFIVLRYKFCYPWIPIPVLQDFSTGLKLAQEQEVAEDWRWPRNETDRARRAGLRNKGARKRRERGHARHAAQTASERQATSQWKSTREREAETPEEKETRNGSSAIRHFERGGEDVRE